VFTEKLRIVIDTVLDKTGLKGFRQSVVDADGVAGKFKAGWKSATDSVRANAAQLALAGGAALVAFGVKALEAFEKSAKAAIDFGKATEQSTESASRWVEVAKDFGVSADTLQAAMGRAAKKGLDFFDVLEQINNAQPGQRAKVAAELLGKSWQGIAPLLGKTREEYEKMLAAVGEGQVITEKEAAKAEKMRLAQDRLSDAIERVTLAFGEFIAENADTVDGLAKTVEMVTDLNERFGDYIALAQDITNPFSALNMDEDLLALEGGVIKATVALDAFGVVTDSVAADQESLAAAVDASRQAFKDASREYQLFMDQLSDEEAIVALEEGFARAKKEIEDTGAISDDTRLRLERMFSTTVGKDATGASRKFKVAVDAGDLDSVEAQIERIIWLAEHGAKFNVEGSWNGELTDGRKITDSIAKFGRNGGAV
jgi:hypothetical protein